MITGLPSSGGKENYRGVVVHPSLLFEALNYSSDVGNGASRGLFGREAVWLAIGLEFF